MGFLSVILPIVALAVFWFLVLRATKAVRRSRRENRADFASARTVDEKLAKYEPAPTPQVSQANATSLSKRPPLPVTSRWVMGPELHARGAPDSEPFGEDIEHPDSREIPAVFLGTWVWEHASRTGRMDAIVIEAQRLQCSEHLGMQPVVAVRLISDSQVAIISQSIENGRWEYSLQFFGLLEGGKVLTDLESADMKWLRA